MHVRYRQLWALVAILTLVVGACSNAGPAATQKPAATTPAPAATTPAPAATTPAPAATTPAPATSAPTTPASSAPAETSAPPETTAPAESSPPASGEPTEAPTPSPITGTLPPAPQGVTQIRWYCCLGGGDAPEQVKVQQKVAADFNAAHPDIQLVFQAVPYDGARDALATQIASGDVPDIVGPLGVGGAESFEGQWLDLTELIAKNDFDMSQFPANINDIYKLKSGEQTGIPFAIYPSALFYKKGLFTEAGISEPPHKYGDKYTATGLAATALGVAEGTQVDWDYNTAKAIARVLTVDKNGKDATDPAFDPENVEQYGFEPQRDDLRGQGAYFGAGSLVGADGKAAVPQSWQDAWKWFYDGMYKDDFIMRGPVFESVEFNPEGYPFFTSKVAMQQNFLWSTYGVAGAGDDWDLAALPSWNGKTTSAFNADTFRVMKGTKHPDEAFTALAYLLDEASDELLQTYGGMPAREAKQAAFFETKTKSFLTPDDPDQKPHVGPIDWQVAIDGIQYADVPNFEAAMPKYNEVLNLLLKYRSRFWDVRDLNMDTELANFTTELQGIWGP